MTIRRIGLEHLSNGRQGAFQLALIFHEPFVDRGLWPAFDDAVGDGSIDAFSHTDEVSQLSSLSIYGL